MTRSEQQLLVVLLRCVGTVTCLAIVAVFMPRSWMAAIHEWLGMGRFPDAAIVEYLARSLSAFYVILGGLLWLSSTDVRRYATLLTYLGVVTIAFAVVIFVVDLRAGMPWFWAAFEGPVVLCLGAAILLLQAAAKRPRRGEQQ